MSDPKQIEAMRTGGKHLHTILQFVANQVKPGITGLELNKIAETEIAAIHATPAFKNYHGYPAALCVSNNDEIVHGIPNAHPLQKGDVVSLDLGIVFDGFFTDSALTVIVTENGAQTIKDILNKPHNTLSKHELLLKVTWGSLLAGIEAVRDGARTGDIGNAVQTLAEAHKFGVVRDLVGHGVGKAVHEEPSVPNFGKKGTGDLLRTGQTIAIEPMITLGSWHTTTDDDDWTIRTADGSLSAHFEHTVLVTENGADILT